MFFSKKFSPQVIRKTALMATVVCSMALTGCASNNMHDTAEIADPFEDFNRLTFDMNNALDEAIMEPIARGYRYVTPEFVRNSVRNALRNLKSPVNIANQVLQGDVEGAAGDVTRMMVNTTFGIGGLFDVAASAGIPYEKEDFGQTLAVWGVDHGPYVMVPFFGPSSFRDSAGILVDTFADPLNLYLSNTDQEEWIYARAGVTALATREEFLDIVKDLRENSFDYYAAVRSAYVQRRAAQVNDQDPELSAAPAIPDYDDDY
ncbi:MAG TPA: VacJ family lipoprotein [Micavibrio sp.]|nr:VacJ family lipoprotein [Micavibrio sp.]HIL29443.1 VacJ family lipoprotein [Micavibrio sp.]